jgi:hypothetical protein
MRKRKITINPYLSEDPMMDELREIRKRMSAEGIDPKKINESAARTLKKYGIKLKTAKKP